MDYHFLPIFLFGVIISLSITSVWTKKVVNLLMYFVFIVFCYGCLLLLRQVEVYSLYAMIVYIGAVTILFAFMVLFVNVGSSLKTREEVEENKEFYSLYVSLCSLGVTLYLYMFYYLSEVTWCLNQNPLNFQGVENLSTLTRIGDLLYQDNGGVLTIMILVMATGLFVVIKLVKNTNRIEQSSYNPQEFELVQTYLQGNINPQAKLLIKQAEEIIKTKGLSH